ncbi:hypothetical protein M409DRAFT_24416 [Zasmidium cellare ATCC 36951]|uniref:Uncharacterized protein n=1 Tax=Zasmidium cellare ATCC 36951 TaxID=1080233 RepID=A0A6A6CH74_ZASCE|nr:uncharacterized protein M409DRAFT_24416 [Zasmidium cellare ATCC 36951]KAF2165029.1 hypothetical protein M409DRAFT_24416 [Zasmidium cellare ATCC 36951]
MPNYKNDKRRVINAGPPIIPTNGPSYPAGIEVAELAMADNEIAFSLLVLFCSNMRLDLMSQIQRLHIPVRSLRSQDAFENAINDNARWGQLRQYEFPYDKKTRRPIDKKHLRYFLHAHEPNKMRCLRVLKLEDFLTGGSHEIKEKKPEGLFYVHVYLADGVDIKAANSGQYFGEPELLLPQEVDAGAPHDDDVVRIVTNQPAATNSNATSSCPTAAAAATLVEHQEEVSTSSRGLIQQDSSITAPNEVVPILERAAKSPTPASLVPDIGRPSSPSQPALPATTPAPDDQEELLNDQDTVMADAEDETKEETAQENTLPGNRPLFIRIGTLRLDEHRDEVPTAREYKERGDIPMKIVVIPETTNYPTSIEYYEASSWRINGTAIADYDNRKLIPEQTLRTRGFQPDPLVKADYKKNKLEEAVRRVVKAKEEGRSSSGEKAAPFRTVAQDVHFTSTANPMGGYDSMEEGANGDQDVIPIVMAIIKKQGQGPQTWSNHVLAALDFQDDLNAVHDWATAAVEVDGGITLKAALEAAQGAAGSTELWVLPQIFNPDEMSERATYQWTAEAGLVAQDWLDAEVWKKNGRGLYLELHILDRSANDSP